MQEQISVRSGASPTAVGVGVGGGLMILAGVIHVIRYSFGSLFPMLFIGVDRLTPTYFLFMARSLLTVFEYLVIGMVVLLAAKRHFTDVIAVMMGFVILGAVVDILWVSRTYPLLFALSLHWLSMFNLVTYGVMLMLSLSARHVRPLKILVIVFFAVGVMFNVWSGVSVFLAVGRQVISQIWLDYVESWLSTAGWLVLIIGVRPSALGKGHDTGLQEGVPRALPTQG